jgi:hypothetical protein
MEREDTARVTMADIRARWNVSNSTLRRHRLNGNLSTGERDDRGRWTFDVAEVEADAVLHEWATNTPLDSSGEVVTNHQVDTPSSIELGELRARSEAADERAARITAERDRARSDHEQERLRADAAERATLEQRARADVATARAEERDRMIAGSDLERDRLMAELDQVRAEAAEARDNARWSYRRRLRKPIE